MVGAALTLAIVGTAGLGVSLVTAGGDDSGTGPSEQTYVAIGKVPATYQPPAPGPDASTGSAVFSCGRDDQGHHNFDNVIVSPRVRGGAHHLHDYVGNLSTDAYSTEQTLAAAGTTCTNGDRSTYYWPVLRLRDGEGHRTADHHPSDGVPVRPASVLLRYDGNPVSKVVPMPRSMVIVTGDPRATTNQLPVRTRVQWSCSGTPDRRTTSYPLCPPGQRLLRIFDFPSCWDGRNTDSRNHRAHVDFPAGNGVCAKGFFPIPQLHIEVGYDLPAGARFEVDTFPEERHSPRTDHADFINVMPDELMSTVVSCLNSGRRC